jgi:hypothetical protein
MLLLAHLLQLNPEWRNSKIIVRSVARDEDERQLQLEGLAKLLPEARIGAETEVLVKPDELTITEILHRVSAGADVVFLGLHEPKRGGESEYADRIIELAEGLNTCIFVRSAGEFAGRLV